MHVTDKFHLTFFKIILNYTFKKINKCKLQFFRNVWPRRKPFLTRLWGRHAAASHIVFLPWVKKGKNVLYAKQFQPCKTTCYTTTHSMVHLPQNIVLNIWTWFWSREVPENSSSCRFQINTLGQLWTDKITALINKLKHIDLISFINHGKRFTACEGAVWHTLNSI